ncbi:MAG: hypothetical protein LBC23_00215 [Coriobacteriales bacterium]|jgi:hypothetical protein|nr:hypothetical protein [Coriobacteriales bacterium]
MIDFSADKREQLKAFAAQTSGDILASLVLIKGRANATERTGSAPFSGADGLALDKAIGSLGWGYGSQDTRTWFGVLLPLSPDDLRFICEVVDPLALVSLDEEARVALIEAFGATEEGLAEKLTSGAETWVLGRQVVSVEGFEAALDDATTKQKVWAQLKRCAASR